MDPHGVGWLISMCLGLRGEVGERCVCVGVGGGGK